MAEMQQAGLVLWRWLRLLLALAALAGACVLGYLSTLLMDRSMFQTEGSPAGAAMFVVLLCAPLGAVVLGAIAVTLIWPFWRRPAVAAPRSNSRESMRGPIATPAPVWRARRLTVGSTFLEAVSDGQHAVLWWGDSNQQWVSHNIQFKGDPATFRPCAAAGGETLMLPRAWWVPLSLAEHAIAAFEQNGGRSEMLSWKPLLPTVPIDDGLSTAQRWRQLVRHSFESGQLRSA